MADEQAARDRLKDSLKQFDSIHLNLLMETAYDRWNFDTGNTETKVWLDVAEEILKERGMQESPIMGQRVPIVNQPDLDNVSFNMGVNHESAIPVISMDKDKDVTIGGQSVSVADTTVPNPVPWHIFDMHNGNFKLGWALRDEIIRAVRDEIRSGSPSSLDTLRAELRELARDAVKERL